MKTRKIRIFEHTSLDGVIAPPGDSDFAQGGWSVPYRSPGGAEALAEVQGSRIDLLLGRRTYDLWSGLWRFDFGLIPLISSLILKRR